MPLITFVLLALEIALLIKFGQAAGGGPVLLEILLTGGLGILLSGTSLLPYAIVPFSCTLKGMKMVVVALSRMPLSQIVVPRWMGVWLGALIAYAFSVAIYSRGSLTSNSMSIVPVSPGLLRCGRPRWRKDRATSTTPRASLNRPGINSKSPPKKRRPSD